MQEGESDADREKRRSVEHFMLLVLALLGPLVLVVLGLVVTPDERGHGTHEQLGMPSCGMIEWVGVPCPGCGVTTSAALVARGRFGEGLHNQPFGFALAISLPLLAIWALRGHLRGIDLYLDLLSRRWSRWLPLGAAVFVGGWLWKIWLHKSGA